MNIKFSNAYDLLVFLHEKDLLSGINIGLRGEFELLTKITDQTLLNLLNEIWAGWRWGETDGEANAIFQGWYILDMADDKGLGLRVTVDEDLLDFHGNPFDMDQICGAVSGQLELENIDEEEDMEFQVFIDLEVDYDDLKAAKYDLTKFRIYSDDPNGVLGKEIDMKLKAMDSSEIEKCVLDEITCAFPHGYEGFRLTINNNEVEELRGIDSSGFHPIRKFMEAYSIDLKLDSSQLELS